MSYTEEFLTVNLLEASSAKTRGVDSFALTLIKMERQMRKIFTFLIFQYSCFSQRDIDDLKNILANNNNVYFEGVIRGINGIYSSTIEDIIGANYQRYLTEISRATAYRNKIFHGQLTGDNLSRIDLESLTSELKDWCELVSRRFN